MIIQFLLDTFVNLICGVISLCQVVHVPTDAIATLSTICCYGAYFCGADFLVCLFASVGGWLAVHLTLGLFLFLWRLLPFT